MLLPISQSFDPHTSILFTFSSASFCHFFFLFPSFPSIFSLFLPVLPYLLSRKGLEITTPPPHRPRVEIGNIMHPCSLYYRGRHLLNTSGWNISMDRFSCLQDSLSRQIIFSYLIYFLTWCPCGLWLVCLASRISRCGGAPAQWSTLSRSWK